MDWYSVVVVLWMAYVLYLNWRLMGAVETLIRDLERRVLCVSDAQAMAELAGERPRIEGTSPKSGSPPCAAETMVPDAPLPAPVDQPASEEEIGRLCNEAAVQLKAWELVKKLGYYDWVPGCSQSTLESGPSPLATCATGLTSYWDSGILETSPERDRRLAAPLLSLENWPAVVYVKPSDPEEPRSTPGPRPS
jgi:hypothetical protein